MEHDGDGDGDGDHAGFHGNELISAIQDEDQIYVDEDDYDDLYNDVNVGEAFYHSSAHRGESAAGGFPEENDDNKRDPPPAPLPAPPACDPPEKVHIPGIAGNFQVERSTDRSGAFPESYFAGSGDSSVPARPPPPPGGPRPDLGQSWPRLLQGHPDGDAFGKEGFPRQGSGISSDGFQRPLAGSSGGGTIPPLTMGPSGGGGPAAVPSVGGLNNMNGAVAGIGGSGGGGGTTTLFVGDLHWWTTDSDLEAELCNYGPVKEVRFFDEKASGKSKGYAQVEFHDPSAATSCKEGMNGHIFNGRPCVVAFSSPHGVRRMGEAQVARNQQPIVQGQSQSGLAQKGGRGGGGAQVGGNFGRGGGGGGGNWGRGGMGNRGHMGNARNRIGPVGGRGIMGNGGMVAPPPPVFNPGAMLSHGFDPTGYGAAMGRMGAGYGGFPAGPMVGAFPGMFPSFPSVVAPHVNPAFFGRGMPTPGVSMWPDPSMGGWGGEEQSSYGDDTASDQQYGDGSRGKDRGADREWPGASERRHVREKDSGEWSERRQYEERDGSWVKDRDSDRDRERERERDKEREQERDKERERDRDRERERDKYRDERDRHGDHYRHRDHEPEHDDDWDRGRSSKVQSNSREAENVKRRRQSE